ncbi:LysM peptidoglycan-binding domain-containing protein, partial [Streptococcus pyogenes]
EGMASIAARAGISISELERLNPEKMTGPGGTWWTNPGDVVRIK